MEIHEPSCFVMCPFSPPFDGYCEKIYFPALEKYGVKPIRADEIFSTTSIVVDIYESIQNADFLLAELSGRNPNVFYELGIAHSLGKPVIMISNSVDDVPFDIKHLRVIVYDTTNADWSESLREKIGSTASFLLSQLEKNELKPIFDVFKPEQSNRSLGIVKFTSDSSDRIFDYKDCLLNGSGEFFISGTSLLHISEDSSEIILEKIHEGANFRFLAMDPLWIEKHSTILTFLEQKKAREKFHLEIENSITKLKSVFDKSQAIREGSFQFKLYSTFFPYIVTGFRPNNGTKGRLVAEVTDYLPEKNRPRFVVVDRYDNCPYAHISRKFDSLWDGSLTREAY